MNAGDILRQIEQLPPTEIVELLGELCPCIAPFELPLAALITLGEDLAELIMSKTELEQMRVAVKAADDATAAAQAADLALQPTGGK